MFLKIKFLLPAAGVLAAAAIGLEIRRERLRGEVEALRSGKEALVQPNAERGSVPAGATADDRAVQAELERVREEVAVAEARAVKRRAEMLAESARRKAADAAALAGDNRDPERGMTKLEFLQNVGRATPEAALQTLVWAALKGDDDTLAHGFALDGRARERAEVLLNRLPADAPKVAASPEKLAALWFAGTVLDVPALHISGATVADPAHVTLIVRGGIGRDQQVPMQLGPGGWQVVVPESAMEQIQQKVIGASPPLPKP